MKKRWKVSQEDIERLMADGYTILENSFGKKIQEDTLLLFYNKEQEVLVKIYEIWPNNFIHIRRAQIYLENIDNFVFDLDGTLLNSEKQISLRNLLEIKSLQSYDKKMIIATGRPYFTALPVLKDLKLDFPLINSNGSMIYDIQSKSVIYQKQIDKVDALNIFNLLKDLKVDFVMYTPQGLFENKAGNSTFLKKRNYKKNLGEYYLGNDILEGINTLPVNKFLILTDNLKLKNLQILKKKIKELKNVYSVWSQDNMLDLMPKNASKKEALEWLSKTYDFDLGKTISFGDADSDQGMFEITGMSAAMSNGTESVKKSALLVVGDNNHNWFSDFIEDTKNHEFNI
ncbi:Cof-type HAD-IIB family hydrolase [Mycoplasma buteonis]|uniref:Cof-type HAD-IIB family hydrolase n=1 Tax=Mycoplasma buteonis TaxID=171280 RepID=UPI000563B5A1|nr:Cof-type HAD-IIB family hydrolase [Mycoplasma buteonis]